MLDISPIRAFQDNYIWLLQRTDRNDVCVVDPGDAAPVLKILAEKNLSLSTILVTHHHPDHVGGVARLVAEYGATVYGPQSQQFKGADVVLKDGDTCHILDLEFRVITVPGHTLDHIAYYHQAEAYPPVLFPGDTLFAGGCGRLFEGTAKQMHHSLSRLADLPDDTRIFCAHEYTQANLQFAITVEPSNTRLQQRLAEVETLRQQGLCTLPSSLGEEKATNPFLRAAQPTVVAAVEHHYDKSYNNPVDTFAAIRSWKDTF